ncbi:LytTR family transcriptional regulator DNA-binding domain-containing protein [uncultured Aquimarina sp.]|uniref:LytTR family transcriptional regulator DNA-binding domain-containing protein n=1 Tax=uncultured Aquimarina sp. TaxID=575652 RepID=UPI0034518C7F
MFWHIRLIYFITKLIRFTFLFRSFTQKINDIDPEVFNRVNKQIIIQKSAISTIKQYFNGKLIVNISPVSKERIVVSTAKVTGFKKWVDL